MTTRSEAGLAQVWCCIGCGKPADVDGMTGCNCPSGLLHNRAVPGTYMTKPARIDAMIADCRKSIAELKKQRAETVLAIRTLLQETKHVPTRPTEL